MNSSTHTPEWAAFPNEAVARERRSALQSRGANATLVGGLWVQFAYALIDMLCILANGLLAFVLYHQPTSARHFVVSTYRTVVKHEPLSGYGGFLLLYLALILLFCHALDLYRTPRTRAEFAESVSVFKAVLYASLIVIGFIYLTGVNIVSPATAATAFSLNVVTLVAWRYAKRRVVIRRVEKGIGSRNAIIIGAGAVGRALAARLEANKLLGYRFKGFLDDSDTTDTSVLGKTEDLPRIARSKFVDDVFVSVPSDREMVKRVALEALKHRVSVKVVPDLFDGLAWNAPLHYIADLPVMDLYWKPIPAAGKALKRLLDIAVSSLALIACAPLFAVCALWIRFDSEGPIVYRSRRVGRKAKEFICYKLRTMVANADELKDSLRHRNERDGPFFKIQGDPRVTRAGRFLRKYSMDELPQFWNVLKGDMSLVGPRPHPLDDYAQYDLDQLRRLEVKPGLTGLWQVTARRDPSFETNMALDIKYIDGWNFLLDLRLLLQTIPVVLRGEGQ